MAPVSRLKFSRNVPSLGNSVALISSLKVEGTREDEREMIDERGEDGNFQVPIIQSIGTRAREEKSHLNFET